MINFSVLKNLSYAKKYLRGTAIIKAGNDNCDEMYIVLRGTVGIYTEYKTNNEKSLHNIGPGGHFGEEVLFLGTKPTTTAVALEDVIALPICRNTVVDFIKNEPDFTFEIIKDLISPAKLPYTNPIMQDISTPATESLISKPSLQAPLSTSESAALTKTHAPNITASSASLFPDGHGSYDLQMEIQDRTYLMDRNCTCPLCKSKFAVASVRQSKLIADHTDSGMRIKYKGIEPLYYDITTCPNCYYSALSDVFAGPDKLKEPPEILRQYKQEFDIKIGNDMDTFAVFAGYYLALLCAPVCFKKPHLITAKLLLKLSRIYKDCGDDVMELKLIKQAFDAYYFAYENVEIEPSQDQQLCLIIGELAFRLGNHKDAKIFLFKAKINKAGSPVIKRQAEDRIEDIRVAEGIKC